MHFKMIIIGKNEKCCLNLLEQYREDKEVSYDSENDYWYNPNGCFGWMEIGGRFCASVDSIGWYDRYDFPNAYYEKYLGDCLTAEEKEQKAQAIFDEGIRQKISEDEDQYVLVVDIHD